MCIRDRPKIVLEVAFSEIVESPEYETGYSLRFPVVKNIRKDKIRNKKMCRKWCKNNFDFWKIS